MLLQVPGGPELLVVLLVFVVLLGVPAALIVVAYLFVRRRSGTRQRLGELEAEVERLRERIDEE